MPQALLNAIPYLVLLLLAGAAEYLKLVPSGTFLPLLLLATGHFMGSANGPLSNALQANTDATKANTEATSTKGAA